MMKVLSLALAAAVATFGTYAFACKGEQCPLTGKSGKDCSKECMHKCHHKHKVEKVKNFEFSRFFIRPTSSKEMPTAAYVTIHNTGKTADKLVAISHASLRGIEIHNVNIDDKGVMQMRPLTDGVEVKAGETVALRPRGLHIMITNPDRLFQENEIVPLTLHFEKAGDVMLNFKVKKLRPMGHHGKHHHGHHGHKHSHDGKPHQHPHVKADGTVTPPAAQITTTPAVTPAPAVTQ